MPTVRALLTEAKRLLAAAPFRPSLREANLLLGRTLGLTEAALLARDREPVPAESEETFRRLLQRRLAGEPVAYLLGEREFYGRRFAIDRRVLVPRPETEHLVEAVLALRLPAAARVLDVGVGSGVIAATLALERPDWRVVGSDLSPAALALARINAERLSGREGVTIALVGGDLAAAIDLRTIDLLVSNPPYIAREEASGLSPEVTEYEPHQALFGDGAGAELPGPEETEAVGGGLQIVARLLREAETMRPGTQVAVEVGHAQMATVRALAAAGPWRLERAVHDYSGFERVAILRRR